MSTKSFTTGEVLTASDTNTYLANSGLVWVATVSVGSGVSSVDIANVFSSTFDSYRVVASNVACSADGSANVKLATGNAGSMSPSTTGYYGALMYSDGTNVSGSASNSNKASQEYIAANGAGMGLSLCGDIINPNKTVNTGFVGFAYVRNGFYGTFHGYHNVTSAYTGFVVAPQSGTFTGGTISVYGYRKA